MFERFEHTADLGLHVEAMSIIELFSEAGRGLTSLLVDQPELIQAVDEKTFEVTASELDYLFFDWLNELLYAFDSEGWLGAEFAVRIDGDRLVARVRGESLDAARHRPSHEVKAITYHGLAVREDSAGRWTVDVIVDI